MITNLTRDRAASGPAKPDDVPLEPSGGADATTQQPPGVYDLLIVVDATSSMSIYLQALRKALPRIISISALTGAFARIGLLGYRDYCDDELLDWSGWLDPAADANDANQPDLLRRAERMEPDGGGDWPEALKTALAKAYEVAREDATTLVLLYTDAPPHTRANDDGEHGNYRHEQKALKKSGAYGGHGPDFLDWTGAGRKLRNGPKHFQIMSVVHTHMTPQVVGYFNYLSVMTHGITIKIEVNRADDIAKITVEVLLSWMGVEKAGLSEEAKTQPLRAEMVRYANVIGLKGLQTEDDDAAKNFFAISLQRFEPQRAYRLSRENTTSVQISHEVLAKHLPKRATPVADFAVAWKRDAAYRAMALGHLQRIIRDDVQAMALNPVFGSLWRAFCNDRDNPHREAVLAAFSVQIEKIADPGEKARMKAWLEESYDYGAEIVNKISAVPDDEKFPCVCLDPTLRFEPAAQADGDEAAKPVTAFTRADLLEIGRSCDPRILARLSKVLTRLTYVNSAADMPDHLAVMDNDDVPKIPMALASEKHKREFWKVLLHTILPGTLLSARAAALLAALSLHVGLAPLADVAETELKPWRDRWNDLEIPETWNVSCMTLLLNADKAYRARHPDLSKGLLKKEDTNLFEQLIAFHLLELNLNTPLTARVGWTPEKSTAPIGPLVVCRECDLPRSVTIMRPDRKCGICVSEYPKPADKEQAVTRRVSKDHNETTSAAWVECGISTCRAQYIVYNLEDLNVRPKCHYCRQKGPAEASKTEDAPCVECSKCLNRMIWPQKLRPKDFSESQFVCPPCTTDKPTIVDADTTAWQLCQMSEDMSWLAVDSQNPKEFPLQGAQLRSVFKIASSYGPADFMARITLFPPTKASLYLRGKYIQDSEALLATLRGFVSKRKVGRDDCSMCFSSFRIATGELSAACGRKGCAQRACRNCLEGWYGLNGPGRIINTAALSCPFCRRLAAGRKLRRNGHGVHAVADLRQAIAERGSWIYGWCRTCGHARRYMERSCARGMPAELEHWACETCQEREDLARRTMVQLRLEERAAIADERERERIRQQIEELKTAAKGIKPCPKCGTMTERTAGCDHIECPACRCHWCYFCGQASTAQRIYQHMMAEHGGLYGGELEDQHPFSSDEEYED